MGSRKIINIDGLVIGGISPVRVESMLKTPLSDLPGCISEIEELDKEGCELARVSLPDLSLCDNFKKLIKTAHITLMADIHFNHRLALAALDAGCRSIRINPGNMDSHTRTLDVIKAAQYNGAVIRIGANGGSLNNRQIKEAGGDRAAALVLAVDEQIRVLLDNDFDKIIISAKSSSVPETLLANTILSGKYPFPIHIGITEAGGGLSGVVKGSAGITLLLAQGIGDTMRVSLTAPGTDEVKVGYHILRALGIRQRGYNLISCPTCGRKRVDVAELSQIVSKLLPEGIKDGLTIAIMGCEVNGPREAAGADLGIAGTPDGFVMFRRGRPVYTGSMENMRAELLKILDTL
ncbi:MAG: (E)-4-hydroxy-3-methylbut-2-enyl-diphosphate synthase [Synergistaceae bacterium]|nr:(E)-4-hydroxy-3-methylbut-2-enyl-diphosphate synthase [Synergistaceae bacterium]